MATQEGLFRELLKDILVQKEDLEAHIQSALEAARNKDDLAKLAVAVKKMEKLLGEIKVDIDQRMAEFIDGTKENRAAEKQVPALSVQPSGKEPYGQRNGTAPAPATKGEPQAVVKPTLLPTPHQQPGPAGRSESAKPSRVFHPYAQENLNGGVPKNRNIPDSQRIFLHSVNPNTTEETLFNYFSKERGQQVVDVKVFYGKVCSAAVGFRNIEAVKLLLPQTFLIDGCRVTGRQYYSKNQEEAQEYANRGRVMLNEGRFQIFCGGITIKATVNDVKTVLGKYGKIRDIRMPTMKQEDGRITHRSYAFVDFESASAAQKLCDKQYLMILGKEVECKPNTKPFEAIMADPCLKGSSSNYGSMADLSASLPKVPPLPAKVSPVPDASPKISRSGGGAVLASNQQQKTADKQEELCMICKKSAKNCVVLWCGHRETCMGCGEKLKNCPGCGSAVESRVLWRNEVPAN